MTLEPILNYCTKTHAGTRQMMYVPFEWIKTFPPDVPFLLTFLEKIELEENMQWLEMKIIPYIHRMERNIQQTKTLQGNEWESTLPLFLPYKSIEIERQLSIMCQYRWVVLIQAFDLNGWQVFGSKKSPLVFTYTNKSGVNAKTFVGYDLNFSGVQAKAPFFVQ